MLTSSCKHSELSGNATKVNKAGYFAALSFTVFARYCVATKTDECRSKREQFGQLPDYLRIQRNLTRSHASHTSKFAAPPSSLHCLPLSMSHLHALTGKAVGKSSSRVEISEAVISATVCDIRLNECVQMHRCNEHRSCEYVLYNF